jgi:hypothetical protein
MLTDSPVGANLPILPAMFATIGHTFQLMKMSWRVLMKDRELILFPLMSGVALLVAAGIFAGVGAATGTLGRMSDAAGGATEEATVADAVLGGLMLLVAYFIVIYFNSALVASAMKRLRGGEPDIAYGFSRASAHIPAILGWAIISATVGLILQALRSRTNNMLGQLAVGLVGGVWAYVTFFVVPVLVAEGLGPITAIKRSGSLFRQTWGRQVTASFGFGLVYVVAMLIAFLPAALLFTISPILGIIVGVILVSLAMATVAALEGIFKAALYDFAIGEPPEEFDTPTLRSAYRSM